MHFIIIIIIIIIIKQELWKTLVKKSRLAERKE